MKLIPLTSIHISPTRQRREFDPAKMQELVEDIRENGLFNCVVLREVILKERIDTPTGPEITPYEKGWSLCQGERRLRAIQDLWELGGTLIYDGEIIEEGNIPYVTLGDLDPLQAEICELSENMQREDLTWKEQSDATARIYKLRAEIARLAGKESPSVASVAQEVRGSSEGIHHENTRREIILSDLMKKNPEIAKAKSLDEAWKMAKKGESARKNAELAESVGRTFSAQSHTILNEDSLIWMQSCAPGKFDVILTDPPYGMGADEFVAGGGGAHGYSDDGATAHACYKALFENAGRITKAQAHLYVFCDIEWFAWLKDMFGNNPEYPWEVHRTPLVWHKTGNSGGIPPWPDYGPRRAYELILYAVKGKRPVTGIYPDVLSYPSDTNLGQAAQKPVGLYADLLRRSVRPGDSVLDPFAGSGPLLPAAHEVKCLATLVEKDAASYGMILNRAKELK